MKSALAPIVFIVVAVACIGQMVAQDLAKERVIGQLEVVATFNGPMPTGVTVANHTAATKSRIFVNFPQWGDPVEYTVAEVVDGKTLRYPNADINHYVEGDNPAEKLISVQSVVVDPTGRRLWILDTGSRICMISPSTTGTNCGSGLVEIWSLKRRQLSCEARSTKIIALAPESVMNAMPSRPRRRSNRTSFRYVFGRATSAGKTIFLTIWLVLRSTAISLPPVGFTGPNAMLPVSRIQSRLPVGSTTTLWTEISFSAGLSPST